MKTGNADFARKDIRLRGMTLVELLVVISILAVLIAILIPAVMASTEAAARIKCASHLKQIELATLAYHDTFNEYPAYFRTSFPIRGFSTTARYYSVFSRIAPQMEQNSLYNQINFQVGLADYVNLIKNLASDIENNSPANATVMAVSVPMLLCPSDPSPIGQLATRGTNYRANYGTQVGYSSDLNLSGPFTYWYSTSSRDVTDGLSQTAAYSEKPRGDAHRASFDGFVDPLIDPRDVDPPPGVLFGYCSRQPILPENYRTTTGINWLIGGLTQTCYNHMEVPNGRTPDCLQLIGLKGRARATARSYHTSGANVAMADGSIRFVTAGIDVGIWAALGTRAGGEVIQDAIK